MAFKVYRHEVGLNLRETYHNPERLVLSGSGGPIASYVKSVKPPVWDLSEMELLSLSRPGTDITGTAILFEAGSDQPGHITLYRLLEVHGHSSVDTTDMVAHFQVLLSNKPVGDIEAFRNCFTIDRAASRPDVYENLKLSGGTRSGSWRWMEIEQILNATVMSPAMAR